MFVAFINKVFAEITTVHIILLERLNKVTRIIYLLLHKLKYFLRVKYRVLDTNIASKY